MRRTAATLAVVALFLMGVAIGGFGIHLLEKHHLPWHGAGHGRELHTEGPPHFMDGIEEQLALTAEQTERVHRIIADSHRQAQSLRHDLAPQVHAQMEEAHRQILEILTPDQRRHLEQLMPHHRRSPQHD